MVESVHIHVFNSYGLVCTTDGSVSKMYKTGRHPIIDISYQQNATKVLQMQNKWDISK